MPQRSDVWMRRIKDVEREHAGTRFALDRLLTAVLGDPTVLSGQIEMRDVRNAAARLSGTYTIRLFAEFEAGLRTFWTASRKTVPPSRARDLLEGVVTRRSVPAAYLADAHAVREYRNQLVHQHAQPATPITIAASRQFLCRYFSFLPHEW